MSNNRALADLIAAGGTLNGDLTLQGALSVPNLPTMEYGLSANYDFTTGGTDSAICSLNGYPVVERQRTSFAVMANDGIITVPENGLYRLYGMGLIYNTSTTTAGSFHFKPWKSNTEIGGAVAYAALPAEGYEMVNFNVLVEATTGDTFRFIALTTATTQRLHTAFFNMGVQRVR